MQTPLVLRADELAAATGGQVEKGRVDAVVQGVSIDSRQVREGDLFVAIVGDRFDGHRFVGEAVRRGAAGLVVSDLSAVESVDTTAAGREPFFVIRVSETTRALQRLGRFVRRQSGAHVVAITGSVGKTTTKELTADVLSSEYDVFRNKGNFNNHIGLPLSLLELRRRPQIAIVELGMNHAGEIRRLVEIAEPETRVWTNVAEVHSEFFESVEAIADAKAEILDGASPDTGVVVNAADPRVMSRVRAFPGRVTRFGVETAADVRATDVRSLGLDGMEATLHTSHGCATLRTSLLGDGNVANALAAIAVALQFDVPVETILARVAAFRAERRRGRVVRVGGLTLVDDSYNSNPVALQRTLVAVGQGGQPGCRVAVLGEMLELGHRSDELHRQCGETVVSTGFDRLVVVGGESVQHLADTAIESGLPPTSVFRFPTSDAAVAQIDHIVRDGDVVLVKGSRGIGTDRIVDHLETERG